MASDGEGAVNPVCSECDWPIHPSLKGEKDYVVIDGRPMCWACAAEATKYDGVMGCLKRLGLFPEKGPSA